MLLLLQFSRSFVAVATLAAAVMDVAASYCSSEFLQWLAAMGWLQQ